MSLSRKFSRTSLRAERSNLIVHKLSASRLLRRFAPRNDETIRKLRDVQHALMRWFLAHQRDLPWRYTRDSYKILVSEIMLQQTQVDRVIPKYRAFLRRFPNVRALARATPREVLLAWAGMGYNRRALYLLRAAQEVVARHGGRVPTDPALLRALPGVGPYTAAAVATFTSGVPHALADTNVKRVVSRVFLGLTHGSSVTSLRGAAATKQTRFLSFPRMRESGSPLSRGRHDVSLRGVYPERSRRARNDRERLTPTALLRLVEHTMPHAPVAHTPPSLWGHAVMDFGALVCKAKPKCDLCPLQQWCKAYPRFQRENVKKERLRRANRGSRGFPRFTSTPSGRGEHGRGKPEVSHPSVPDRIYRGRILQMLREHDPRAVSFRELSHSLPDVPGQRVQRLIRALASDGLLVVDAKRARLPG